MGFYINGNRLIKISGNVSSYLPCVQYLYSAWFLDDKTSILVSLWHVDNYHALLCLSQSQGYHHLGIPSLGVL